MTCPITPTEDRIVVRPDAIEKTTASGLVLPEQSWEGPVAGTVLAVGPGVVNRHGVRINRPGVRVGEKVLFNQYTGREVTVDGQEYLILWPNDVLAVVT